MTTKQAGVAPTSKYGAKVAANRAAQNASEMPNNAQVAQGYNSRYHTGAYQNNAPYGAHVYKPRFQRQKRDLAALAAKFDEHVVRLAAIVKDNASIRRFTSIGIINYLKQQKIINGESAYVDFKWNKFGVKSDGIMNEYRYTEQFFLNALIAAYTSAAANAQSIINKFCEIELNESIETAADKEQVAAIIESNAAVPSDVPFETEETAE